MAKIAPESRGIRSEENEGMLEEDDSASDRGGVPMTQEITFTVPPELFPGIGTLSSGVTSPLSPYLIGDARPLTPDDQDILRKAGVLDTAGRVAEPIRSTIEALANPVASIEIRLAAGAAYYEHTGFFAPDSRVPILLSTVGTSILVRNPAPIDEILEGIQQYVGASILRGSRFAADLDPEAAATLAATIDLHRRAVFRAFGDVVEFKRPAFDRGAILAGLASRPEDPQWLAWSVARFGGGEPDPERFIDGSLGRLVAAGHLAREGDRYALAPDGAQLAERLLFISSLLSVQAGRLVPPDTYHQLQFICLQAGLYDILAIEAVDGRLRFDSLASVEVMEYLRYLLSTPDALARAGAAADRTCPSCGAPVFGAAKFCKTCGTPLAPVPAPSTCPRCGATTDPCAKFCRSCGAPLG